MRALGFEPAQNEGIGFQNGHRFSMMIRGYIQKLGVAHFDEKVL